MEDEYSFYIFLFLPWEKMFSVKISFVVHGRRTFFLHFLASSADEEILFTCYYLRPWTTSVLFLFYYLPSRRTSIPFLLSVNPMLQRHSFSCFFSMGLISNSHRVERCTNFLIMKSAGHAAGQDRMEAIHALHTRASQDNGSGFAERLHEG